MTIVASVLLFSGFSLVLLSQWVARAAWPKFKNLERRGVLKTPVPDIEPTGNTNSMRTFTLLWATKIPQDRPQLRRLVLLYRGCQIGGVVLMLTSAAAMSTNTMTLFRTNNAPPSVTLTLPDQDH